MPPSHHRGTLDISVSRRTNLPAMLLLKLHVPFRRCMWTWGAATHEATILWRSDIPSWRLVGCHAQAATENSNRERSLRQLSRTRVGEFSPLNKSQLRAHDVGVALFAELGTERAPSMTARWSRSIAFWRIAHLGRT